MSERTYRFCDVCGGFDDHPRHVQWAPGGSTLNPDLLATASAAYDPGKPGAAAAYVELNDTDTICRHLDCCSAKGCPDGSCTLLLAESGGARGADLVTFLMSRQAQEVSQ